MIDREEVLRIAALARLELSGEELERMTGDLSKILEYVAQLARVQEAAPEADEGLSTPRREDRVSPSRHVSELLNAAPAREGALVRVPRVIDAPDLPEPAEAPEVWEGSPSPAAEGGPASDDEGRLGPAADRLDGSGPRRSRFDPEGS